MSSDKVYFKGLYLALLGASDGPLKKNTQSGASLALV